VTKAQLLNRRKTYPPMICSCWRMFMIFSHRFL
jgi:hypothetical protein